ncbi:MAG: hypothetical protein HY526_06935 [Betaproteobacteria bacterium]|nr:hypothetical protein [Betaproteobacteria bacterium]
MHADHQAQIAFHLTGKRPDEGLDAVEPLRLRPALFTRYADLPRLRYDFPLVLVRGGDDTTFVQSLAAIVDKALNDAAPQGTENERLRKHVLRLEREIRSMAAAGATGSLSEMWNEAAHRLGSAADELLEDSVSRAGAALKIDGEVADCAPDMPARLLAHGWRRIRERKTRNFHDIARRLILKLANILRADYVHSQAGQSAGSLKAAIGKAHGDVFDFDIMSGLLAKTARNDSLPASRRRRIEWMLSVLESQRFFPAVDGHAQGRDTVQPYAFEFDNCAAALDAFRERQPKMIELAKALAIGELETEGHYLESKHNLFFEEFGENALGADDLALFPDYLVCVRAGRMHAEGHAELMSLLATGLPVKIMLQCDDILQESLGSSARLDCGMPSTRLASMATGLNDVYVLQSGASHLVQLAPWILRGLAYAGPALFSVYSGAVPAVNGIAPYLVSAAAVESRAFPVFVYDPSAGPDWASRFALDANPQPERDCPTYALDFEGEEHQRLSEQLAFTFADFAACDPRHARHLARVPRAKWNGNMLPAAECIARDAQGMSEDVPFLLMADGDHRLHRVIVDDKLMLEARRCAKMWRSIQELGGVHNSHAEKLLARERKAWEEKRGAEAAAPAAPLPAAAAPAPAPVESAPEPQSDEAHIETPRCTSCDECTQINNAMFAYDANKQAYIANIEAGTYRQLVEAAESCQVSIIHPGKPRNPNEPGIDELLKRAEPFL